MPTIYLPQDPRATGFGQLAQGLGSAAGQVATQIDAQQKLKDLQQKARDAGGFANIDPTELAASIGTNPLVKELVGTMMKQESDKAVIQHLGAQTALARQEAQAYPMRTALIQAQTEEALLKVRQGPIDQRLKEAQIAMDQAKAAGDIVGARKAAAEIPKIQAEAQKAQGDYVSGVIATSKMYNIPVPQLLDAVKNPAKMDELLKVGPPAAQGMPQPEEKPLTAVPNSGYPAGTDLNNDTVMQNIRDAKKTAQSIPDILPGVSIKGAGGSSYRKVPIPQAASSVVGMSTAFSETLTALYEGIRTGQVTTGPIAGRLKDAELAFSKNPNDPNAIAAALFPHQDLSTLAFMPGTRGGFRMLNLIRDIVASRKDSPAVALDKIQQSSRVLRDAMGQVAKQYKGYDGLDTESMDSSVRLLNGILSTPPTITKDKGGNASYYQNPTSLDPDLTPDTLDAITKATGQTKEQIIDAIAAKRKQLPADRSELPMGSDMSAIGGTR